MDLQDKVDKLANNRAVNYARSKAGVFNVRMPTAADWKLFEQVVPDGHPCNTVYTLRFQNTFKAKLEQLKDSTGKGLAEESSISWDEIGEQVSDGEDVFILTRQQVLDLYRGGTSEVMTKILVEES